MASHKQTYQEIRLFTKNKQMRVLFGEDLDETQGLLVALSNNTSTSGTCMSLFEYKMLLQEWATSKH